MSLYFHVQHTRLVFYAYGFVEFLRIGIYLVATCLNQVGWV